MVKRFSILATLVAVLAVLVVTGCGGGGGSSDWSDEDVAALESYLSSRLFLPQSQIECIADKVQDEFSPSIVQEDEVSASDGERLEVLTTECTSDSLDPDSSPDGDLYGGPACQEELESAACIEEVQEKTGAAVEEGEERRDEERAQDQEEFENEEGIYEYP